MPEMHELLAAAKVPSGDAGEVIADTLKKFSAPERYFRGEVRTLDMIEDSPEAKRNELEESGETPVRTTVHDTLDYMFKIWAKHGRVESAKGETNAASKADVVWNGQTILKDVPVDTLLSMENELGLLRKVVASIPTSDAGRTWTRQEGDQPHVRAAAPVHKTKTAKKWKSQQVAPATEKFKEQAELKEVNVVIGHTTVVLRSGEATSEQAAAMIERISTLQQAFIEARTRANTIDVIERNEVPDTIVKLLMQPMQ